MRVVFRLLTPFVIVTVAAFGFTASAGAVNEFGDVQRGRWYAEPIDWLVGEGITNGTSEGCFSPYAQITRGQVVTFLYRLDQTRDDTEVSTDTATSNGHPFVDVWAGIRPRAIDRETWPEVPLGTPWKEGVCDALGESVEGFWARLRGRVTSFADLEPELVGAVERLIDFVAGPEGDSGDETG